MSSAWVRRFVTVAGVLLGACGDGGTGPDGAARVRFIHASPDAASLDVLVDGQPVVTGATYKSVSAYLAVGPGARHVRVRVAGTNDVLIDEMPELDGGTQYTLLATGGIDNMDPLLLTDDNTAPPSGAARVRLIHAAPNVGNIDIYVTPPGNNILTAAPALTNIPFRSESGYVNVLAGTYQVRITPSGTKVVAIDTGPVNLASGMVRTAIAVEAPGGGGPFAALIVEDRNP